MQPLSLGATTFWRFQCWRCAFKAGKAADPISEQSDPLSLSGRNRGAIISQYYNRTMQLRRRRPSIQDFSRSARPSIRGYGIETDATDAEDSEGEENDVH